MMQTASQHPTANYVKAALVGCGISGSLTPSMHEAVGTIQGLRYRYDLIDTTTDNFSDVSLEEIVSTAADNGYDGLNITHPYKVNVIGLLDDLTERARVIGAVNTVVFRGGKRFGYNTDYSGFQAAFQLEMSDVSLSNVLLLGAGGAATAVAFALLDQGVEQLLVYDKFSERAEELASRLSAARSHASVVVVNDIASVDYAGLDGIVNSTPMGMKDYPGCAIDTDNISPSSWVADIVYFPLETELLSKARNRGCRVMNGSGMAINQAAEAFTLITGFQSNARLFADCFAQLTSKIPIEQEVQSK